MVYTAPTALDLQKRGGSVRQQLADELEKIDTELEGIELGDITLTDAQMLVGSAQNKAAAVNVTGDVTIDNAGATTIGAKKVTAAKMYSAAAGKILITQASNAVAEKTITGDITIDADGVSALAASGIAAEKLAVADGKIIIGDAAGDGAEQTMTGDITMLRTGATAIGAKKVVDGMVALAQHKMLFGQSGGAAEGKTVSGDVTAADSGAITIAAKKVTAAKMASATETDAGKVFVTTGTAYGVAEVEMAGDATIAANGTITIEEDAVTTAKIDDEAVTEAKIEEGGATTGLTGLVLKQIADNNVIGAIPVVFKIPVADSQANYDILMTHTVLVLDFWAIAVGAGHATNDTLTLKNGTDSITNAVQKGDVDKAVKRAGTIDPAYQIVEAGNNLRVAAVKATNCAADCYVLAVRIAAPA